MQKTINTVALRKAVENNPRYQEALDILARRARGRNNISFRRLRRLLAEHGKEWTQDQTKALFLALQDAGAGRIVYSDKTTPRFFWDFHLTSVACAALNRPEPVRAKKDGTPIETPEGELRKPSPPRITLPRVVGDSTPVAATVSEPTQAEEPKALSHVGGDVVEIRRPGMRVEVDLSKMSPAECRQITELLLLPVRR